MPYLIKRPGSPYWIAGFDVPQPDGTIRRLKKSTKKKKRSEAMEEAMRLEVLARKTALGGDDIAAKAYGALAEAADAAAKGELSEARAREILAKLAEASTGEKLRFYTIRTWAQDWLASKANSTKAGTAKRYHFSISSFLDFLGPKADGKLESLTKADIRSFRDAAKNGWKGRIRSAKTVNYQSSDVAAMLRAAVREGLLLASPAAALEKLPEDDSMQREVFTVAEVAKLVETAAAGAWQDRLFSAKRTAEINDARSAEWAGMILVGFYSGARLGDCATLRWEDVDFERSLLSFVPAKSSRKKKRLLIPIHTRLRGYLLQTPEDRRGGPLFPVLGRRANNGTTGLSAQFGAITDEAGIDRRQIRPAVVDKDGKVKQQALHARTFHSLRHSLTSNLANADVPEEIRRRITGHDSAQVHQIYTHTEAETLARAVNRLPLI